MRSYLRVPLLAASCLFASSAFAQQPWMQFGGNAQHTGQSNLASRALDSIVWQTPIDLFPPYSGPHLLGHYGAPVITPTNTVVIPLKTLSDNGFKVQGRNGNTGNPIWTATSTYTVPPHNWYPSFNITLLPPPVTGGAYRVAWPESGGRISIRKSADLASSGKDIRVFYGSAAYQIAPGTYNDNVKISTPLTCGPDGSIYFGYVVLGTVPNGMDSGIAKIGPDGRGRFVPATTLSADPEVKFIKAQSAPALSNDGTILYTVTSAGSFQRGMLVALNSTTLAPIHRVALKDPKSGADSLIDHDGTASPLVAPDGDVYVGTLENPFGSNNRRGFLLHFSWDLQTLKIPSPFGWDNTPSIIPATAVPFYRGSSPYLLFTKYNEYSSWIHRLAILDPFKTQIDPISGATVMKEVAKRVCPSRDLDYGPDATKEWCINTTVVDVPGKCGLANASDGKLWRWDFVTNRLDESIRLTSGIGEAYASVAIGTDGKVYAINNATLFAVGSRAR